MDLDTPHNLVATVSRRFVWRLSETSKCFLRALISDFGLLQILTWRFQYQLASWLCFTLFWYCTSSAQERRIRSDDQHPFRPNYINVNDIDYKLLTGDSMHR